MQKTKAIIIALLILLLQAGEAAYGQEDSGSSKRSEAFANLCTHCLKSNDLEGLRLLCNFAMNLGDEGRYDLLELVSTNGIPPEESTPIFRYLLNSRNKHILIGAIDEFRYEYGSICTSDDILLLEKYSRGNDEDIKCIALDALKTIKEGKNNASKIPKN